MAAQEAQRASFIVERAKQQRLEKIVQAEGEAQSAKMVRRRRNVQGAKDKCKRDKWFAYWLQLPLQVY